MGRCKAEPACKVIENKLRLLRPVPVSVHRKVGGVVTNNPVLGGGTPHCIGKPGVLKETGFQLRRLQLLELGK